jgi:hypothetical protein
MPIVSDDGIYEDELHRTVATIAIPPELKRVYITKDEVPPAVDPGDDGMVITPEALTLGRELDNAETNPSTGTGLEVKYNFESVDWSKMNQEFGSLKSTSKEDTAVVATTASPLVIIREGDIKESMDVGMGAGPASIAGVRAATLPKAAYELAVDAEKQGFSPQEIFKSTGFFKGADDAWRFEIDDSAAKYFPENLKGGQKYLSDVLSHKELFDAYPDLKFVKVREDPSLGAGASYAESTKLLLMGPQAIKDKGIFIHEVQHAIQGVENANKGGSPGRAGKDYNLKYEEDVNKLRPEFLKLQTAEMRGELLSEKQQSKLDYLREVFKKYVEYSRAGDQRARENYEALAGEVEARNAQHRVDLTPQERMRFNPVDTEDIARSKQLVRQEPSLTTPYVKTHPYDNAPDFHTY